MGLLKIFSSLFSKPKSDPLDELLTGKGIDPDELMDDINYNRKSEGRANPVNRFYDRQNEQNERAEKMKKWARNSM